MHSSAWLDFDGDCLADIFITCEPDGKGIQQYQIWKNMKSDGWRLGHQGSLPRGSGAVTFGDMGMQKIILLLNFIYC